MPRVFAILLAALVCWLALGTATASAQTPTEDAGAIEPGAAADSDADQERIDDDEDGRPPLRRAAALPRDTVFRPTADHDIPDADGHRRDVFRPPIA